MKNMAGTPKPLDVEREIRDDLDLIVFSVDIAIGTGRMASSAGYAWARTSMSLKNARLAGDTARLLAQKLYELINTGWDTYLEGKSRRITVKSMNVCIERRGATEASRLGDSRRYSLPTNSRLAAAMPSRHSVGYPKRSDTFLILRPLVRHDLEIWRARPNKTANAYFIEIAL